MKTGLLIFPHQLFENNPLLKNADVIFLIEDYLYFRQYKFHKQKLILHRASMKAYEHQLLDKKRKIIYLDSTKMTSRRAWMRYVKQESIQKIICNEVVDYWLEQDLIKASNTLGIQFEIIPTPMFINSRVENTDFFKKQKKPFMKTFYEWQRKRLSILMDENGKPQGGVFSFDAENRKKLPKHFSHPPLYKIEENEYIKEAKVYISKNFKSNYGSVEEFNYSIDSKSAKEAFEHFLTYRLEKFGDFEDAISSEYSLIHHSVLTPYLNIGLVTPAYIIKRTLEYVAKQTQSIPLNSLEGFLRQIIGWREFMRAMYDMHGNRMRTSNFFNHTHALDTTFWTAHTNNVVLDTTIARVLKYGYCHHIERLMVLGNYMLLSEINPDEVYKWFMELFIDSYDWVMVPNVYDMSQFADGGIFATKPYICASNYIIKMSNYKKDGVWNVEFDTKFWDFLKKHRIFLSKNIRFKMLLSRIDLN